MKILFDKERMLETIKRQLAEPDAGDTFLITRDWLEEVLRRLELGEAIITQGYDLIELFSDIGDSAKLQYIIDVRRRNNG